MHLSMHNWMRAEPLEVTCARLAKYGYESIEISGEPTQYKLDEVKQTLSKYGLRCWGSVTLILGDRNLVSGNEANRAMSVQYTKDCIDLVAGLNGTEMTIVPATVGKVTPDASAEQERDWAVTGPPDTDARRPPRARPRRRTGAAPPPASRTSTPPRTRSGCGWPSSR